ncbi:MAG: acetyltransferase, partial [Burkholderiales bacterium]
MRSIYAFNGDADGLCALQQLLLAEQFAGAELVTGPKRRIDLLKQVHAGAGDRVTVLDLSFRSNADAVIRLLAAGARVRYFDHHHAGELPAHPGLEAYVDTSAQICTSAIVDRYLAGAQRAWAVVGAFGDNLPGTAASLAAGAGLSRDELPALERLGVALNYNAYGETEDDLFFPPKELHLRLAAYRDPRDFVASDEAFRVLCGGYDSDLRRAAALLPAHASPHAALYALPQARWARRVS